MAPSICNDVTGKSGEFFSQAIGMVLIAVLDCEVLDHLINNVAPSFVNKTSPLANCLVESKEPTCVWQ